MELPSYRNRLNGRRRAIENDRNKSQTPNRAKSQAPNPKLQGSSKSQAPGAMPFGFGRPPSLPTISAKSGGCGALLGFGAWCFFGAWNLVFGAWDFLGVWSLEFGAWISVRHVPLLHQPSYRRHGDSHPDGSCRRCLDAHASGGTIPEHRSSGNSHSN